jgi:hypothetical protein
MIKNIEEYYLKPLDLIAIPSISFVVEILYCRTFLAYYALNIFSHHSPQFFVVRVGKGSLRECTGRKIQCRRSK